jgi:rare lipoprotein A (peptidoglycan hydrolase)
MEVTDRGPHLGNRGLDLSRAAAQEIGLIAAGTDEADVRVLTGYEGYGRASREERGAGDALESATVLFERPHLKVLGASFTPYSMPSAKACQEASMMLSPKAGARLPSAEPTRTRVTTAVRCSSSMRTLQLERRISL